MPHNALNNRQRNTGIGRERDECVAEAVEGCHDGLPAATFNSDAHCDVRRLEDLSQTLVELPFAIHVQICNLRVYESVRRDGVIAPYRDALACKRN